MCLAYTYPVYAYVRRSGHAPAIAQDIVRSFLGEMLSVFRTGQQPIPTEHFRRFLLARLNAFLAVDWRIPLDESVPTLPVVDLEPRYVRDFQHIASPDAAFQRGFALELLARASRRLASEARQTGHSDMLELLMPYLVRDPAPGVYDDIARQLHTRTLSMVVALKRLRQRFRELVGRELADTVTSATDLLTEQQTLYSIFQTEPATRQ
ncbi:MAG: hypothetical protein ABIR10_14070 [Dokdonella sp.]